jgi:YbbR domain-containing protein
MGKILKAMNDLLKKTLVFIDKKVIVPITQLIIFATSKYDKSGKQLENWLSKANTILYVSLALSIITFVVIDQRLLMFSENSAEFLKSQPVTAVYNQEAYVVEGLPSTVDITLIGNKADLYFAKQSPSQGVTIDLSTLKPGKHKVNITYNQALPSINYIVNPSFANIVIYQKVSTPKIFSVDLLNADVLDEKLIIKNIDVDSDTVVVKGANYQISEVATVKALVDIKNLVKQEIGVNTLKDVPLKAYNQKGEVVDVELVPSKIDVNLEIASPSKQIAIKIVPIGNISFGKAISAIETNLTTITVYGDETALVDLKAIEVPIDVEGLKDNRQYKVELTKPVGVKSMDANNITVNISLGESAVRDIVGITIDQRNLRSGYVANGLSAEDVVITVSLKGVDEVINKITAADITAYIDLTGLGAGTHQLEVQVEGIDSKVQYIPKTTKVNVIISAQ